MHAVILDYGLQIKRVDNYVNKLEKFVNNYYPDKKIILLGFSMGGLIVVRFAQKNNWKNIEKILTFAAPFKGSPKAKNYKILPGASDMSPNSKLLKEIYATKIPKNKLICVSAKKDQLVDNSGTYLPNSTHITLNVESHESAQTLKNIKPVLEKELLKYK